MPPELFLDNPVVITLSERVDTNSAPNLRLEFRSLLDRGAVDFIVDLVRVTFLDSAGLAALVQLLKQARAGGGNVRIVMPADPNVRRIFSLTRFDAIFDLHTSISDAAQSFVRAA